MGLMTRFFSMVVMTGLIADSRALLAGGLIGEWKRHQNNLAELKARHRPHRPSCPILFSSSAPLPSWPRV